MSPENKPFKLNLWALKKTTEEKKSVEVLNDKKDENKDSIKSEIKKVIPVYKKEIKSPLNNILEQESLESHKTKESEIGKNQNSVDIKKETLIPKKSWVKKLDFSKMKKKNIGKEEEKKEVIIEEETKEEIKTIEVFQNYESDFNKNKESILEKIKKFKNFIKPKTRIWFLGLIIWITALWISSLFILAPEKHNLENYKVNLLLIKNNIECKYDANKCPKKETTKTQEKQLVVNSEELNNENKENKTIKKEIFIIKYNVKIVNWKEIIIYDWKEYNSMEEFNKDIKNIINKMKKDKLRDFILNSKNK